MSDLHADVLRCQVDSLRDALVRVTTGGKTLEYKLDRWD